MFSTDELCLDVDCSCVDKNRRVLSLLQGNFRSALSFEKFVFSLQMFREIVQDGEGYWTVVTLVPLLLWGNILLPPTATDLVHHNVLDSQPLLRGHEATSQDVVLYPELYLEQDHINILTLNY